MQCNQIDPFVLYTPILFKNIMFLECSSIKSLIKNNWKILF